MKKALKIIGVIVALSAILLVISSVALHVLLPPEKAKALVLKQMTGQLKRDVKLGDVSVGILSGLSVSDLKVSESPDFSKGTFLSSDQFSIRLALLPLLFRHVEVKQLTLKHPMIQIVRYADGKTFNFSDLISTSTVKKTARLPEGANPLSIPEAYADPLPTSSSHDAEPPFRLLISRAQIQDGVIHFVDRSPAKQSLDIDPLNLKLKNVSMTSPFTVQADLQVKARGIMALLKLAGEADLASESFKVKTCTLSSGGSTLELSGTANHLKSNRPDADLTLSVKEFTLSTLAPFMGLPRGLKLVGPIVAKARVKGDERNMNVSLEADLAKVQVVYGKQFQKPAGTPMGITFQGDLTGLQDLSIEEMKAVLGTLQLNVHGKVLAVTNAQPQASVHLETNAFSVTELMSLAAVTLPPGVTVKGKAQLAADVSGTQTSSRIAGKLEGKDLEITSGDAFKKPADMPLHVSLVGERVQQTLTIQSLSATLGSIELTGNGTVALNTTPPKFQMALASKSISLQEAARLSPLAAAYKLAGTAGINVRASGTADAPVANGSLTLQDASLHYQESDLTHIVTNITFTQQDVSIPKLTGKLNGSDISLKLTGHKLTTQPDVTVEANITELDLNKLLPPAVTPAQAGVQSHVLDSGLCRNDVSGIAWAAAPPPVLPPLKTAGHLTIGHIKHEFYDAQNLDLKWALTDVTPDLALVNGTSTLKQGPGKLQQLEKLVSLSKTARIALLPITTLQKLDKNGILSKLGLPSLQTLTFSGIHGDYVLHAGVMDIKTFDLTGQQMDINTVGTIGLAGTQPLNLRVTMKMAPGTLGGSLGQFVADDSGRPTLAFNATGTVADPHVKADLQDAGRKAVQQLGGQLLKGILGGGAAPSAPATDTSNGAPAGQTTAPPAPAPNPADDLKKALNNIFRH